MSATPPTHDELIDIAISRMAAAEESLQDIIDAGAPNQALNKVQKANVDQFLDVADRVKKVESNAIKSIKEWKRVKKNQGAGKSAAGGSKGATTRSKSAATGSKSGTENGKRTDKRKRKSTNDDEPREKRQRNEREEEDEDEDEEDEEERELMAKDQVRVAMHKAPISISDWFDLISQADGKNMFIDAARGLLCIAPGIEDVAEGEMDVMLLEVLSSNLQERVLATLLQKRVEDIQPKDLHYYYKASSWNLCVRVLTTIQEMRDKNGALNKRSKVALLQHIVLSVHTLKSALGWSLLENGHKTNGKITIVRQAYEAACEYEGRKVDFKSGHFESFHKSFKDYNTGCNRFLDAYVQLGSNLLLCQRLRIQRFADTRLGPKLSQAIFWMALEENEAHRREAIHHSMLQSVIRILEGDSGDSGLLDALKDINQQVDARLADSDDQ